MSGPRLCRKLLLEERQAAADGAGGFTGGWVALGTHWAEIAPRGGGFASGEAGALSRMPLRIRIRAVPPDSPSRPRAGQRFREETRIYTIRGVSDARGPYLDCSAVEEVLP